MNVWRKRLDWTQGWKGLTTYARLMCRCCGVVWQDIEEFARTDPYVVNKLVTKWWGSPHLCYHLLSLQCLFSVFFPALQLVSICNLGQGHLVLQSWTCTSYYLFLIPYLKRTNFEWMMMLGIVDDDDGWWWGFFKSWQSFGRLSYKSAPSCHLGVLGGQPTSTFELQLHFLNYIFCVSICFAFHPNMDVPWLGEVVQELGHVEKGLSLPLGPCGMLLSALP